jgi:uncharacterized membrane-anchored protein
MILASKRSNAVLETIAFFVVITILATVWIFANYIGKELNTDIQADDTLSADAKAQYTNATAPMPNVLDGGILFFLIIFWITAIISAYFVDTHPVFFVFTFILLLAVLGGVVYIGNMFHEIFYDDITGQQVYFPMTFWIFNHLLAICIVMGFSIMGAMFAKPR